MIVLTLFRGLVRFVVFCVAVVTAAILIPTAMGVVFTAMKWQLRSELLAACAIAIALLGAAAMIWLLRKRLAARTKRKLDFVAFATWSGLLIPALVAAGFGASYFFVVPPLTVLCLRPLGSWATPMLMEALECHPEAGTDARDQLRRYPDAVARNLPRLRRILQEEDRGGHFYAVELVTQLGPRAAAAAPEVIEELRRDVAESEAADSVERYEPFDPKYLASRPWIALVAMGDVAIPELIAALEKSTDSKERLALACILRYRGPGAAPAVDALMAILRQQGEEKVEIECRRGAISALAGIGPKAAPATELLKTWASDPRHPCSMDAIRALGAIGLAQPGVVDVLVAVTQEENAFDGFRDDLRGHRAIEALGQLGPKAMAAVPTLVELMTKQFKWISTQRSLDRACLKALAKMGPDGMLQVAAKVVGEKEAYAVEALGEAGPAVKEVLPLLRKGMESTRQHADRTKYAVAIERIAGPSDAILIAMAEGLILPYEEIKDQFPSYDDVIRRRLRELGNKAKVVAPVLKKAITHRETGDCLSLAKLLWRIDRDAAAVLPVIVDDLQSKDAHLNYGYEAEWLLEVDPSGETIVPALAKYVATQEHITPAMDALMLYGTRARAALPEIRKAEMQELVHRPSLEAFLFSVSPVEFFFSTFTGRFLSVLLACVACLIVETFWFRWRLFRRTQREPNCVSKQVIGDLSQLVGGDSPESSSWVRKSASVGE